MKLLLDTATLLRVATGSPKLSDAAVAAYMDTANESYVSVASLWKIIVKNRLGKLTFPMSIDRLVAPLKTSGAVKVLTLTESAVYRLGTLPDVHRDPFDRMLVCQAVDSGLTVVTPDAVFARYPVTVLW